MKFRIATLILLLVTGCTTSAPPKGLLGAYALDDGRTASVRRSIDDSLRYRIYESGDSGRLYRDSERTYVSGAGFAEREPVELRVEFITDSRGTAQELRLQYRDGETLLARRIGREREVWFESDGSRLYGRLHLPDGPPPYPAIVLVHGSGDTPGTEWFYNSDFFVANGFAAFTYDKRGSGRSAGSFTFDFHLLASDAVAAAQIVASQPEVDPARIGLSGYSQGAWVAPLAAATSDTIKFVIVNYGIIESPAEEARLEMRQILVDAGVGDADLAAADELIRAAIDLVAKQFDSGWPEFLELKNKHRDAPWLDHLRDTPVGQLVRYPRFLVGLIGKARLPDGLLWHYDSTRLLESSDIPMAWLLAEKDLSAPNAQTIAKLRRLIDAGKPLDLIVFPDADHGMLTFAEGASGREYTGYAPGYFRAEVAAAIRLAGPASEPVPTILSR